MFNIYANDYAPVDPLVPPCEIGLVLIGYQGENQARCMVFDLTKYIEQFGEGTFTISHIRQDDTAPYLVAHTDLLDNQAIWEIDSTDTAKVGYGVVQLAYVVDDVICKTAQYRTTVLDANGTTGEYPDPYENMLDQMAAYAAAAAQSEGNAADSAEAAAQSAADAEQSATDLQVAVGQAQAAETNAAASALAASGSAAAAEQYATQAAAHSGGSVYVTDMRDNNQYLLGFVVTSDGEPAIALTKEEE